MTDPRMVLAQARQGLVPADWRVFTKRRGMVSGFLRGTSNDPDPLLVITPEEPSSTRASASRWRSSTSTMWPG